MKYIFITTLFILLISGCSSSNKKNTVMKDDKPVVNKEKSETGTHSSDKTERKEFSKTKCVVENDVRYLKIVEMDPKGCELFYEKFSKRKIRSSVFIWN